MKTNYNNIDSRNTFYGKFNISNNKIAIASLNGLWPKAGKSRDLIPVTLLSFAYLCTLPNGLCDKYDSYDFSTLLGLDFWGDM
jgi:hypothetical protein